MTFSLFRTQRTNSGVATTYTFNELDQVTGDGTYGYSYNAKGSRTYRTLLRAYLVYTYDDENQLIQAATDTSYTPEAFRWKTDFVYDGKGRLRVRKEYAWQSGTGWSIPSETRYLYDGMRVIYPVRYMRDKPVTWSGNHTSDNSRNHSRLALSHGVKERNGSNTPAVAYTRGLDLSGTREGAGGIGGLLARSDGYSAGSWTTHNYYHADGGGNVTYMINSAQSMVATYKYDPFGRTLSSSGALAAANLYRFSSKQIHLNSGFYYYGYRFYDPMTQRWLNRDPIGTVDAFNLYDFTENDAVNKIDPFGLEVPAADSVDANPSVAMDLIIDDLVKSTGMSRVQVIKRISLCYAIHKAYKGLNCKGCGFGCLTKAEAAKRTACLSAEIGLRGVYLRLKCDYFLPGSLARGSAKAEAGHKAEIVYKTAAMLKCNQKAAP